MDKIKFDEIAENTDLANEYLKNNTIIKSKGFDDIEESVQNDYKNIIHFSKYTRTSGVVVLCNDVNEIPTKLFNLAKKIEKNVDLFCQLELLIRQIPLEVTKNIDIKLITQNLFYHSSLRRPEVYKTTARQIVVCKDSPLLALGCVAQALLARMPRIVIECTKDTAPVCSLFIELCHEVGLKDKLLLAILPVISEDSSSKVTVDFRKITDFLYGGVGIVTGKCDVDSAVDTFLAASCRYPWALKKVYVQESVLERFKRALAWKAERQSTGSQGQGVGVSCAASYRCRDKVFVVEATDECAAPLVAVEAYRTVRELMALLGSVRPLAASLWSSDVAESLEIAHSLDATLIWINGFGDFRGPPRVSQAFFSVIDLYFSTQMIKYMPEFDDITKLRKTWLRMDINERKELVLNTLSKFDNKEAKKIMEDIETLTLEMDSFVYVTENMVSTGVEILPDILLPSSFYDNSLDLSIICYIIKGGSILLHIPKSLMPIKTSKVFYMFYEQLRTSGAPVLFTKKEYNVGNIPITRNPIYRSKVIWTNYGTIFAN